MTGWIIAICSILGLLLTVAGVAIAMRVSQARQAGKIDALKENDERQEKEIESLRDSRHEHAEWIHEHQIKIEHLEKRHK